MIRGAEASVPTSAPRRRGGDRADAALTADGPRRLRPSRLPFSFCAWRSTLSAAALSGQLDALAGRFAVEKALAPRVERDFRPHPRLLAGQHDVRGDGAVVEQPERVVEPLLRRGLAWPG